MLTNIYLNSSIWIVKISFSQKGHKPQGKKLSGLARSEFSRSCKTPCRVNRVTAAVCHLLVPWELREAQLVDASSVPTLCGHITSKKILCAWLIKSGLLSNFQVGVCICGLSSPVRSRLEVLHTSLSKEGRKTKTKERRQKAKDTSFTFLHYILSRQMGEALPTEGSGGAIRRRVSGPMWIL